MQWQKQQLGFAQGAAASSDGALVLIAPECQNLTVKSSRCTCLGVLGGPWMVLWTMLVHGFGSILGRFAAVLVFFASCPVSFWSSSDKFLEILVFYWVTAIILRFFLRFCR